MLILCLVSLNERDAPAGEKIFLCWSFSDRGGLQTGGLPNPAFTGNVANEHFGWGCLELQSNTFGGC